MASANTVSRHLGRAFDRSRKESDTGFEAFAGDDEGTVFVHYTLGDLNYVLNGDEQRKRIEHALSEMTEHLRGRWIVRVHPKLHNMLVLSDLTAGMTYDEVQPDTRVNCHSRGNIKGNALRKFMGGTDNAEELVHIAFDDGSVAYNTPEQLSPLDEPAPEPKLSRAYRGTSSFWLGGYEYEIFNQAVRGQDVRGFWACARRSHDGTFLGNEAYIVSRSESRKTAFAEALAALRG